jgi:hypothetical protein
MGLDGLTDCRGGGVSASQSAAPTMTGEPPAPTRPIREAIVDA